MTDISIFRSLDDLASTINHEHELVYQAALDVLSHAILCGEALIEARATVPDGQWLEWVRNNVNISATAIQRYIRIASYGDKLMTADKRPRSINAAISYLRDIEAPAISRGRNGRAPSFDVSEAKRLRNLGMTYEQIGEAFGVSDVAIWRQLTPDATRKAIQYTNHARSKRRRERRALAEQQRAEAVARVGGSPADAYALLRKCAIAIDRAMHESGSDTEKLRVLRDALAYVHRAEDAITRALGIERGRRYLKDEVTSS